MVIKVDLYSPTIKSKLFMLLNEKITADLKYTLTVTTSCLAQATLVL